MSLWDIIPAVGGVIDGIFSRKASKRNTDKTIQANKELAKYSYSKDLEMWERANAYDNPAAQMQRLKDAGLNPNLVYGSGSVTGNSSSTLPKYQTPRVDYNYEPAVQNVGGVLDQYLNMTMKQAQVDNLREQRKSLQSDAINKAAIADWAEEREYFKSSGAASDTIYKNQRQLNYNSFGEELMKTQLQGQQEKNRQTAASISKIAKDMERMDADIAYKNKLTEWYETNMWAKLGFQGLNQVTRMIPGLKGISGKFMPKK